jgi:glycosyltransferase involved in cell wall biosynthesis
LRVPSVAVYQLPNTPVNLRQQLLKRLTARWTTAHVGVGKRTAREVETVVGLRHGRVRTIYNGVPDVAAPPAVEARDGAPTIGAVGRLAPQKGFDLLLRALVDVPAARAVIVGRGDEHPRLEALARDLGVAERTSLLGWVDDPRALLSSFDVFALPSRFEGFPLSVLEAQLAELPVVAANVGSVGEAVLPGATGLLVEPEDPRALAAALNTLLADAAERHRLGRAGRQLVLERFTAAHMTRAFERLYVELTG